MLLRFVDEKPAKLPSGSNMAISMEVVQAVVPSAYVVVIAAAPLSESSNFERVMFEAIPPSILVVLNVFPSLSSVRSSRCMTESSLTAART